MSGFPCSSCGSANRFRTGKQSGETYVRYGDKCRNCGHKGDRSCCSLDKVNRRKSCKRGNRT